MNFRRPNQDNFSFQGTNIDKNVKFQSNQSFIGKNEEKQSFYKHKTPYKQNNNLYISDENNNNLSGFKLESIELSKLKKHQIKLNTEIQQDEESNSEVIKNLPLKSYLKSLQSVQDSQNLLLKQKNQSNNNNNNNNNRSFILKGNNSGKLNGRYGKHTRSISVNPEIQKSQQNLENEMVHIKQESNLINNILSKKLKELSFKKMTNKEKKNQKFCIKCKLNCESCTNCKRCFKCDTCKENNNCNPVNLLNCENCKQCRKCQMCENCKKCQKSQEGMFCNQCTYCVNLLEIKEINKIELNFFQHQQKILEGRENPRFRHLTKKYNPRNAGRTDSYDKLQSLDNMKEQYKYLNNYIQKKTNLPKLQGLNLYQPEQFQQSKLNQSNSRLLTRDLSRDFSSHSIADAAQKNKQQFYQFRDQSLSNKFSKMEDLYDESKQINKELNQFENHIVQDYQQWCDEIQEEMTSFEKHKEFEIYDKHILKQLNEEKKQKQQLSKENRYQLQQILKKQNLEQKQKFYEQNAYDKIFEKEIHNISHLQQNHLNVQLYYQKQKQNLMKQEIQENKSKQIVEAQCQKINQINTKK